MLAFSNIGKFFKVITTSPHSKLHNRSQVHRGIELSERRGRDGDEVRGKQT